MTGSHLDSPDPYYSQEIGDGAISLAGPRPLDVGLVAPRQACSVLHVINGEHYSGAERVQDLLSERLPEYGFPVAFACVKPDKFAKLRHCRTAPIVEFPMKFAFDLRVARRVAKLARRGGFSLIHAHTPRSAFIAMFAARWAGLPWVFHVHSPTARDSTRRWQNWINHRVERMCLAQASALICVSRSLSRFMWENGYPSHRLHVVSNGTPRVATLENKERPLDEWTLGTVALFRPRKGVEVLLEALAALKRRNYFVRLRAVGGFETPDYEQQVKRLAQRLNVDSLVDWVGFASDIQAELRQMDAFILPSLFGEGLPMVVLEAMSAGVPVVATEVEGVPEAITHAQEGLLVRPNDPHAMANELARLLDGHISWSNLRQQAWQRHSSEFSDHSMAQGVAKIYRQVLEF